MGFVSKIMFIEVILCSITAEISGCIDKEKEDGIDNNLTPYLTPFQTDPTVSPASKQLFLHPNSSETFQFQGNNLTISYLSPSLHLVDANIDMDTEAIEINRSTICSGNHCGYYATKDDIDCSIEPVVWRYNEACEIIWSFDIWNSSEIYFEVHVIE